MSHKEKTQALGIAFLLIGSAFGGVAILGATGSAVAQSTSASFVTVDDTVRVHSTENTEIRGETDLKSGTNVTVRVEGENEEGPFIVTGETQVDEDGEFAVAMNFAPHSVGSEFTVKLVQNGNVIADSEGKIVPESKPLYQSMTETTESTNTSEASSPGFSIGTALVALIAAVVVVGRRD